ncbi:MAG TPA: ABC transporter substrate-binding protein [Stellaceae bacterium]|jgi:phospholipid transport system substrate-binding protein|nr:ABC transporter substrate-binding protein [Stellaceae bacterium]
MMHRFIRLAVVILAALQIASAAAHAAAPPEATIRSFYARLLQTMREGPQLGDKGRYQALAPAIRQSFDLPAMAEMAVGLAWTSFSPAQRQQVTDAFARYTIATYANSFDSYGGQRFEVTGARTTAYGTIVDSRIIQANGNPVAIDYLMLRNGDNWQIKDVYLTGTVSQLATLRAQFSAVLGQQGVRGLVATLNRKADTLVASSGP